MTDRDQRLTFVILWIFAVFNYVYGDIGMIFSLIAHPDQMGRMGQMLTASGKENLYFLGGAVLMEIAFLTMLLSWLASYSVARWMNILAGILFTVVMGTLLLAPVARGHMPPLNYYSFCAVVEIIATVTIVWRAWNWRAAAA
jgi:lysylphosphatidylglycerol synthetase-like protein (DUF2156 family)